MDPHSVVLDMFLDDDMSSCSYSSFTSGSPYYHTPPSPQPVFSHLLSDVSESSSDDDLIHKLSNDLELPLSMDEFDQFSGGIWNSSIGSSNNIIKSPWSSESTSSFTSQETRDVKREPASCDLIAEELTRQLYPNLISDAESCVTGAATTLLKQEPNSPQHFLASPPPSDDGDDLWELLLNSTGDVKPNIKILDTPPVTPPQMSDGSPPHSPQPPDPSPPMTKTFILQPSQARNNNRNNSQSNQPIKVVTITTRNNFSGATKGGRISKTTKIQPKVITSSSQPQVISIVNSVNSAKLALPKSACVTGVSNSNNSTSRILQLKAPVRVQQQRAHTTQVTPIITHSSSSSPATHGLTNAIISHTIGGQPTILTTNTQNGSASLAPLAPALQPGLKNDNLPDMKLFKRQQRMIKNRESASLSRKKKKEYVTTLEGQLSDMDKDNCRLKEENTRLQQRISSLESELTSLRQSIGRGPSRKATTALFAVMVFAMLNMAPLTGVLLSSESRLNTMKTLVPGSKTSSLEVPKFHQRSLLWTEELSESSVFENDSDSNSTSPMCPKSMNATESLRVATQLQGWFERKTSKISGNSNQSPTLPTAPPPPPPPPPPHPKTREGRKNIFSTEGKLNTILQIQNEKIVQLKESMHALTARAAVPSSSGVLHGSGAPSTRMYSYLHPDALHVDPSLSVGDDTSVVDVPRFGSFLDAIQRRDDTYYVVSFSSDQVLIPASSRNDSSRPRMSLLLPTAPLNGSMTPPPQHIAMMQIDCEVTYTKLVHISEDLVPLGMRNNKPTNVSHSTPRHGSSASIKRERKNYKSRLISPHKEQDPTK